MNMTNKTHCGSLMRKVVSVKLLSGEELIGRLNEFDDNTFTITRPLMLVMGAGKNNQAEVAFVPWILGVEPTTPIKFPYDKILYLGTSGRDASTKYQESTGDYDNI